MRTDMFPLKRPGIAEGGNCPWDSAALPHDPERQHRVRTPRPDFDYGHPTNQSSLWSGPQHDVITHAVAWPYTQPARGNTFPFFMVEMKSEAAEGTPYVAERQVAGSACHSVNALAWLLQQAETHPERPSPMDTMAFTVTMSHRVAVFYLHWYCEADSRHCMSYRTSYSPLAPQDIRACHDTVKNILDWGLGARRTLISTALAALFPVPPQWEEQAPRLHSTIPSSPVTPSAEEPQPKMKEWRTASGDGFALTTPIQNVDGDEEWEVERILDSKIHRGRLQYLVEWLGFDDTENQWLSADDVANSPNLLHDSHHANPNKPRPGRTKHCYG